MKIKLNKSLKIFFFFLIAFPLAARASFDYKLMEGIPGFANPGDSINFYTYVSDVYKFGIWAIGIAALLMIVVGGYMYIMSAGNNSQMEKAKGVITDAIIGIIMVMSAYVLLYEINPDLVKIKPFSGPAVSGVTGTPITPQNLAVGCSNYTQDFQNASGGDKNLQCLLEAMATQESSCDPNKTSPANPPACGIMQLEPATASLVANNSVDCQYLIQHPADSITWAADLLKKSINSIPTNAGFSLGTSYDLGNGTIQYGQYTYAIGNDDLIASYNAGYGDGVSSSGKKAPFAVSSDCKNPVTPAWQCDKNSGGFNQTQDYVTKVQAYQKACLTSS